jgi:hypothetical protein
MTPAVASSVTQGTTLPVRVALINKDGERIGDGRASSLVAAPCKVKFSASGAQDRSPVCMKYDAIANLFFLNWPLGTGTGSTELMVAATYKYSMPETITTTRLKTVTIIE